MTPEPAMPTLKPNPDATTDEPTVHHVSQRKKRGLPPVKMQLQLTSMIDVIFQLLIYFIVTASFTLGEGVITAKLPQGGSAPATTKPPDKPLNITLTAAGNFGVSINVAGVQRVDNFSQLIAVLEQLQYDPDRLRNGVYKPDNPILIKPAGQVRWQHVVNAFNSAVAARYTNVSFAQVSEQ